MVLASIARIPPAAIAVMKAITASDAFSSEEGAEGDGRAAAWAVLLRRLLATRAFAVFCAGPGQEHVHSDVDHGAGQEPGHGGPQAPSLNRLTDELERQGRNQHTRPKGHDRGDKFGRNGPIPRRGSPQHQRGTGHGSPHQRLKPLRHAAHISFACQDSAD